MRNYRRSEARQRAREPISLSRALHGDSVAEAAERAERYAGLVKIEKGSAAYRITFPKFRESYHDTRPILEAVKSIPGRRFDSMAQAWTVPNDQSALVELIAEEYAATIEPMASAESRIAELEHYIGLLEAELERHATCVTVAA